MQLIVRSLGLKVPNIWRKNWPFRSQQSVLQKYVIGFERFFGIGKFGLLLPPFYLPSFLSLSFSLSLFLSLSLSLSFFLSLSDTEVEEFEPKTIYLLIKSL